MSWLNHVNWLNLALLYVGVFIAMGVLDIYASGNAIGGSYQGLVDNSPMKYVSAGVFTFLIIGVQHSLF